MRILTDADVLACLPPLVEVVDLVADALSALAEGRADVPPKPTVRTSPGMFANAMPAAYPERNLLGCKWISVVPDNPVHGLPTASGVMVINDGTTGVPRALLPAHELTAIRTAAVTGACIRALVRDEGPIAYLGAGVQARSHLRILEALGHTEVHVWARRREAIDALVSDTAKVAPGIRVVVSPSREAAVRDKAVVITGLSIGLTDMTIPVTWPRDDALLLPIDYASSVGAELADSAVLAADDPQQFAAVRAVRGKLDGYPTPTSWTGHLLHAPRPEGRLVVQNLGTGITDLVVASAIADGAEASGTGQLVDI
ncbi:ornithine cyclodeaminase/mu-crystallin family protein [Janibacter sp. HTCC2649]|uniref:ornithine cyclodeaminase/mu-crystallin family protein n=1 Tax=Janibacter sp. HTCC2649 TaxID=313589 RepID=UPI000066EC28|nr:ornithine cyclodeaminase/mu-crystallin family protein [Janibacter sp. HTCC2649]EAP99512.1 ornithine cyclodeaminase/mu-crystallin family protein [Janibacter sp. HTCC2649]